MRNLLAIPALRAGMIIGGAVVAAWILERVLYRAFSKLAAKTDTDLDDRIVSMLRRPMFLTTVFLGAFWATATLRARLSDGARATSNAVIITLAVLLWTGTVMRIGALILRAMSVRAKKGAVIQPSSLPLFDILLKVVVVVVGTYAVFLAWHIDLTAWLASAGIIGVAVGFGAKDTLANLFAGIFILVDAPYKVGDVIVLDAGLRGRVTDIGIRSTRILTMDNVEITVPNGIIGNSQIVNEAGGPDPRQRLRVAVQAAYGSDIDRVREVLLGCTEGVAEVAQTPAPEVLFMSFGDSGLDFVLLAWVKTPAQREAALNALNSRIYKRFAAADLEIPYPKQDVYLKEMAGPTAA